MSLEKSDNSLPSASLYIGDLHQQVSEGTLFEHFSKIGPVASVRVCRDATTRESLGYAYLNFRDPTDAERALDIMNFTPIKGVPCRIMRSQRDPALRRSGLGNLFVKNLPQDVDNKVLYDMFSKFGNVLSCKVATDPDGKSKEFGYVHFETEKAAEDAILKLNDQLVDGQAIRVEKFPPKSNRKEDDPNNWTNVYIKNIPPTWTDDDLLEVVKEFGTVQSHVVKSRLLNGTTCNFAFVNFAEHTMALACVDGLNDREIEGQKISAREALTEHQIARRNLTPRTDLYVRGFEESLSDEEFKNLFSPFGAIRTARIMRHPVEVPVPNPEDPSKPIITTSYTGASKGFGIVTFEKPESATAAIEQLHGTILGRGRLYVVLFPTNEERREARERLKASHPGLPENPPFMSGGRPYQCPYRNQHFPRPTKPAQFFPQPQYMSYNQYMSNNRGREKEGRKQEKGEPEGEGRHENESEKVEEEEDDDEDDDDVDVVYEEKLPQPKSTPSPQPEVGSSVSPVSSTSSFAQTLAYLDPQGQKKCLQDALYPMISSKNPSLAGRITGMLLEMENDEILKILESPDAFNLKVEEAIQVLRNPQPSPIGGGRHSHQPSRPQGGAKEPLKPKSSPSPPIDSPPSLSSLANMDPQEQKNSLGEALYPMIYNKNPSLAGKITGMLLEMDNAELINLLECTNALNLKVDEALDVLRTHGITK